jgi:cytochrome c oxidase subunit 2
MEKFLGFPLNASTHGAQLDYITGLVHWLMLVLFVGWGLFFLYTLVRFRKSRNPVASYEGAKSHFSTYGEAAIALIEVILLVGFAVPIWANRVGHVPKPSEAVTVRVMAQQFAWNVQYPGPDGVFGRVRPTEGSSTIELDPSDPAGKDDILTLNQLHLPVGKTALIELTSRDVIHSFFLPYMRVKQDAIPGITIPVYFTPNLVTPAASQFPECAVKHECWEIACAQLCGASHYRMRGYMTIDTPESYAKWLSDNAPKPAAAPTAPATLAPSPAAVSAPATPTPGAPAAPAAKSSNP